MTILTLVPRLLEILSHLATSYHIFSHLIRLSRQPLIKSNVNDIFKVSHRLLKILSLLATSCHMLSHLIKLCPPSLIEKQCE